MRDSHLAPSGATAELAIGAISALFRDHHGELVRLALLTAGDLPTSEGLVQDVYASLHTRWDKASGWDAPRAHVKKDADLHVPIWLQGTQPVQTRYQLKLVNPT